MDELRCVIIITEPNRIVGTVHDRMLTLLHPAAEAEWLNLEITPEQATELLQTYPDSELKTYEISPLINSPLNDTPELINPIG